MWWKKCWKIRFLIDLNKFHNPATNFYFCNSLHIYCNSLHIYFLLTKFLFYSSVFSLSLTNDIVTVKLASLHCWATVNHVCTKFSSRFCFLSWRRACCSTAGQCAAICHVHPGGSSQDYCHGHNGQPTGAACNGILISRSSHYISTLHFCVVCEVYKCV